MVSIEVVIVMCAFGGFTGYAVGLLLCMFFEGRKNK